MSQQQEQLDEQQARVRELLQTPALKLVGEGSQGFDQKANAIEKEAAARAQVLSGTVARSANWENQATAAQREERRRQVMANEKKVALGTEEIRAKYKIEITFVSDRKMHAPNKLGISIWESGKRFHGGGDELMFWCKDNRKGHDEGCWGPILAEFIRGGVAMCPKCQRMVNSEYLTNMRIGNVTNQNLAKELELIFHALDDNADFYVKYHTTDVHYIAMEKAKGPDVARRLKGMSIYPLRHIIKDCSNGASLEKRIYAFITS